jgi:hypothetical protein
VSQRLTVKNNQTGETITFDWHDPNNPPTEADIEEVFAAAAAQPQAPPDTTRLATSNAPRNAPVAAPGGRGSGFTQQRATERIGAGVEYVKENPAEVGAAVAGLAAAPFTGGASAAFTNPLARVGAAMAAEGLAAGTGAVLGRMTRDAATGQPVSLPAALDDAKMEAAISTLLPGVGPLLSTGGRAAYHMALRPRLAMSHTPEDVAKLVETGVREGINVSRSGFQKAGNLIESEANEVRKLVASLNGVVDPQKGFQKIEALKRKWLERGALDEKIAALDDVARQYGERYGMPQRPTAAHDLKQGIWHETQNNWDKSLNPAKIEGQKAFGSGLREEIEAVGKRQGVDDIGTRNERIGNIADLQEVISGRAAHEELPGMRQSIEFAAGTASPGFITRAVATSAPVLSSVGRKMARIGDAITPRGVLKPVSSHPPIGGKPKTTPTSLDQLGIPETAGPAYAPDSLDRVGVPVERGVVDLEQMWLKRFEPEPAISHKVEYPPVKNLHPVYAKQTSLDELDIPAGQGPAESSVQLDALDIPATQEVRNSEELWLQRILEKEHPQLAKMPRAEQVRFIQEMMRSAGHRSAERNSPPAKITKDKVETLYRRYLTSK